MTVAAFAFERAMPVLECADLTRSVAFYRDKLGFAARVWGEPPTFAIVQRGRVSLALNQVASPAVSRHTWAAYVYVANADALHAELAPLGVAIAEPPETRPYGCRDFVVDDPDGHIIAFGQVLTPDPLGPGLATHVGRTADATAAGPVRLQTPLSGGCQCGAVRFTASRLGRASMCHCRMCQKAFGGPGGALVTAHDLVWTRGTPAHFKSSNLATRGFCGACGTPLTFEAGGSVDVAIACLDEPARVPPVIELARESRLAWLDRLGQLPVPTGDEIAGKAAHYAGVVSNQHPDHDTATWPATDGPA